VAAFQNFMQFTVHGTYQNLPWQNSWVYSIDEESPSLPVGELTFTAQDLEDTVLPIWNNNVLIQGLRSRYASLIPAGAGTVEGIRVIARSQFMLTPVQFQLDDPTNGTLIIGAANRQPSFMSGYCRGLAEQYGQSPARFFVPALGDEFIDGQNVTDAFRAALNALDYGILNSINSNTHVMHYQIDGSAEANSLYRRTVVARIKTTILPPNPPYKGKYSYDFPLQSGVILAYPVGNFILQPAATTQTGRKK